HAADVERCVAALEAQGEVLEVDEYGESQLGILGLETRHDVLRSGGRGAPDYPLGGAGARRAAPIAPRCAHPDFHPVVIAATSTQLDPRACVAGAPVGRAPHTAKSRRMGRHLTTCCRDRTRASAGHMDCDSVRTTPPAGHSIGGAMTREGRKRAGATPPRN